MSDIPLSLYSNSQNEDQTLEIHSEILEPLSHSQQISRFEIPHKNLLDADSQLIWKVFWDKQNDGTDHRTDGSLNALPFQDAGLLSTIHRARLYVDGVIISELNEVGKFLTLKNNFRPHEVKVEKHDLFSYADHNLENIGGKIAPKIHKIKSTTADRSIGREDANYLVECSVRLGDIFGVLEGAQLDTNSILGKIMIEIDWNVKGKDNNVSYVGTALNGGDIDTAREVRVADPRLILDFLTYNDEVQARMRNVIFSEGGMTIPFKEVALVRKTINAGSSAVENSEDFFIGMTGRAVQKIWLAKVNQAPNLSARTNNNLMGEFRSDLLDDQRWNCKINDLMIFDRDVRSRAEEFNYVEQGGEGQFTCEPSAYERRSFEIHTGYATANDIIISDANALYINGGAGNIPVGVDSPYTRYNDDEASANGQGQYRVLQGAHIKMGDNDGTAGAGDHTLTVANKLMGRKNYLCVPCGKYTSGGTNSASAIRVGSTPIVFTLQYNGANDAETTRRPGTAYFFVEYLKQINIRNGLVKVMDL